jgi:transposase-like protein
MAYREVTMIEITEVLRQWRGGSGRKRIARRLGLDPKTVRRYVRAAEQCGLGVAPDAPAVTEAQLAAVLTALRTTSPRAYGESWHQCVAHREFIATHVRAGVRLSKIRRLLIRQGVAIAAATLYRFATAELGVGRTAATVAVADGAPGEELAIDTGWMTLLQPDAHGRRRRFRAWIFTPNVSRYRFVYPCFAETTATAIDACEAAWAFYGGVFKVLLPDNTKTIITRPDPLQPRVARTFLEYAQARGFVVDPARVRRPTDKARVERSVPYVREDCFGGEPLTSIDQARVRGLVWSRDEAGQRRHSRTQRRPREHFEAVEQAALLPAPTTPYDVPQWSEPKVARDHFAQVARALYSLPTRLIGHTLEARADTQTVRFYDGPALVKTHPRQPPGGRVTDPTDFPPDKSVYALRDVAFLEREATRHGAAIGTFARALLAVPLPWTRMRRVYALLGLVKRYGAARVDATCQLALAADCLDVTRLQRMLALAAPPPPARPSARVIPLGRYLRPASTYTLARGRDDGGAQ